MNINETALILQPPEVLNVVTTGAHLLIDASRNVKTTNLFEARNDAESKYPEGWVEAEMITKDKESHIFINQGASWLQGRVKLFLSRTSDIDTDLEFVLVKVSSCSPILGGEIKWVNHKH